MAEMFNWFKKKKQSANQKPSTSLNPALDRIYKVGDKIGGDFSILSVMQGGLGVVYVVENKDSDRFILKGPKRQFDEKVQSAFLEEARTWVQIGYHPNVVPAFWVDEVAGQLFIAAELIEPDPIGRISLRDFLNFGPLTAQTTAAFTLDFCYGLEFAVSKGLHAHRASVGP